MIKIFPKYFGGFYHELKDHCKESCQSSQNILWRSSNRCASKMRFETLLSNFNGRTYPYIEHVPTDIFCYNQLFSATIKMNRGINGLQWHLPKLELFSDLTIYLWSHWGNFNRISWNSTERSKTSNIAVPVFFSMVDDRRYDGRKHIRWYIQSWNQKHIFRNPWLTSRASILSGW